MFFEQSCKVHGLAVIGCAMVLRAELLVVGDVVGYVTWLCVFVFVECGGTKVTLSAG